MEWNPKLDLLANKSITNKKMKRNPIVPRKEQLVFHSIIQSFFQISNISPCQTLGVSIPSVFITL